MANQLKKSFIPKAIRYSLLWVAFAIIIGVFVISVMMVLGNFSPLTVFNPDYDKVRNLTAGRVMNAADPVQMRIPKIDLEAGFEGPLGLQADRSLQVPVSYDLLGWYKFGPTPGELGPAVVVGHVDSRLGPAVFWSLGSLVPGDEIFIDRADGTTATFVVTELERPRQNEFPTVRVYGDIDHAGLRLITCSGTFVRGEQRYTHNLIVYARLVTPEAV